VISDNNVANRPSGLRETLLLLEHLACARFYGRLEVKFEAGNIVHLTETRSMKPYLLAIPEILESNLGQKKKK